MTRKTDDRSTASRVDDAKEKPQNTASPKATEPRLDDGDADDVDDELKLSDDEIAASFERFRNREFITGDDGGIELIGSAEDTLGVFVEELLRAEGIDALAKRAKLSKDQIAKLRVTADYVDVDDAKASASKLAALHGVPASAVLTIINSVKALREDNDGPSMMKAARKRLQ